MNNVPGGVADTSFSVDGRTVVGNRGPEFGKAVAVQTDGRILVAGKTDGDMLLARLMPDGGLDPSFGNNGIVVTDLNGAYDEGKSLVVQPDGRILLGGITTQNGNAAFALVRYMPDGRLDRSFSDDGIIVVDIAPGSDEGKCIALQSDGSIVVAGQSFNGQNHDFALARVTAAGVLDASFGRGGVVVSDFGGTDEEGNSVRVQSDGRIVVVGAGSNGTDMDFAIARYDANGMLDATFGGGGFVRTRVGEATDRAFASVVQPDGRTIAAGVSMQNGRVSFAAVRYGIDGALDLSFGRNGVFTSAISASDECTAVALLADGRVVLAGSTHNGTNRDFVAMRLTAGGVLDPTFGVGGSVVLGFGTGDDSAYALATQPDGRIVLAGESHNGSDFDLAVVRLLP